MAPKVQVTPEQQAANKQRLQAALFGVKAEPEPPAQEAVVPKGSRVLKRPAAAPKGSARKTPKSAAVAAVAEEQGEKAAVAAVAKVVETTPVVETPQAEEVMIYVPDFEHQLILNRNQPRKLLKRNASCMLVVSVASEGRKGSCARSSRTSTSS